MIRHPWERAWGRDMLLDGRYLLRERLGAGSFGDVVRAYDLWRRRSVAIKRLREPAGGAHGSPDAPGASPGAVSALRWEARAALRLDHPRIVALYDWVEGREPYLAMEYVPGGSLRAWWARAGGSPLPVRQVRAIVLQVGRGLSHAHRRGVIHRDLKPANILVAAIEPIQVKVTDFGIAGIVVAGSVPGGREPVAGRGSKTGICAGAGGRPAGTPAFMAPEVRWGEPPVEEKPILGGSPLVDRRPPVDERADVFGLAALTYLLLTGKLPYGRGGAVPDACPPTPMSRVIRNCTVGGVDGCSLNRQLDDVILSCLSVEPSDRPSSVRALMDAWPGRRSGEWLGAEGMPGRRRRRSSRLRRPHGAGRARRADRARPAGMPPHKAPRMGRVAPAASGPAIVLAVALLAPFPDTSMFGAFLVAAALSVVWRLSRIGRRTPTKFPLREGIGRDRRKATRL